MSEGDYFCFRETIRSLEKNLKEVRDQQAHQASCNIELHRKLDTQKQLNAQHLQQIERLTEALGASEHIVAAQSQRLSEVEQKAEKWNRAWLDETKDCDEAVARAEAAEAKLIEAETERQKVAGCDGNCSCAIFSRHEAAMALYEHKDRLSALQTALAEVAENFEMASRRMSAKTGNKMLDKQRDGMREAYLRETGQ